MVYLHSLADRVRESLDRLEVMGTCIRRVLILVHFQPFPSMQRVNKCNSKMPCRKTCKDTRERDHI